MTETAAPLPGLPRSEAPTEDLFRPTAVQADAETMASLVGMSERIVGPREALLAGATTALVRYAIVHLIEENPNLETRDVIAVFMRVAQTAAEQVLPKIKAMRSAAAADALAAGARGEQADG